MIMATFLTTAKMSPALAARVEAAVTGRPVARRAPGQVAVARLFAVALAVGVITLVTFQWKRHDAELEGARGALIGAIQDGRDALSPREHQLVSRASALLREAVDAPPTTLREGSLETLLAMPAVYVRGARQDFASPERTADAIRDSVKDTFVLCLIDPSASDSESAMLERVQVAYSGGLEERTRQVSRLHTAALGLPFFSRDFMKQAEEASSLEEVGKLRTAFDRAPRDSASRAAKAELLIYVLDDPADDGARAELDGTARHRVRVGMVHIPTGKPYLRFESTVDPSWISESNRPEMSRGLTGCRLGLEVRRAAQQR